MFVATCPPLQILDIGSNGCGTSAMTLPPISVQQIETPLCAILQNQNNNQHSIRCILCRHESCYQRTVSSMHGWCVSKNRSQLILVGCHVCRDLREAPFHHFLRFRRWRCWPWRFCRWYSTTLRCLHYLIRGTPVFTRVAAVNSFWYGSFHSIKYPRSADLSPQPAFGARRCIRRSSRHHPPFLVNGTLHLWHHKIEYNKLPSFTGGQNTMDQQNLFFVVFVLCWCQERSLACVWWLEDRSKIAIQCFARRKSCVCIFLEALSSCD